MNKDFKEYSDDRISIKLCEGIIHIKWQVKFADYDFINEYIKKGVELTKMKSYPMIIDISELKGITKEARQRLSEDDSLTGVSAAAVVYVSGVQKVLFSIYGIIYTPKIPVKLFKNKEKALEWLQQFN